MQELETDIKATVDELNETKAALKKTGSPKKIDYLQSKEVQLIAKEVALRDELKRLHSKEEKRLDDLKLFRAQQLLLIEEAKKYPLGNVPFPGELEVGFDE
jgi:hypothetical protein